MNSYTRISKTFDFDAAHHLPALPDGHKCKRPHGHTYRVEFVLCGPLDQRWMVADYAEIAEMWQPIHDRLDHNDLNKIMPNPTTEVLAWWIMREFRRAAPALPLVAVRVYESLTTWAETYPPGEEGWPDFLDREPGGASADRKEP